MSCLEFICGISPYGNHRYGALASNRFIAGAISKVGT